MRREVRYFVSALVRYFSSLRSSVRNTFDVGRSMLNVRRFKFPFPALPHSRIHSLLLPL